MSNSFFFKPTTGYQVKTIIMAVKNMTSNINTYSTKILKSITAVISPTLTRLMNNQIFSGHITTSFKIARVVLVFFKSGDTKDVNNYRPLSILHTFSKISEKVVCHQLYICIYISNILSCLTPLNSALEKKFQPQMQLPILFNIYI